MVTLTINSKEISVEEGTSILSAAKTAGAHIPSLCYCQDVKAWASCGICVVKNVDPKTGRARMVRACCTSVTPGMNIITDDADLRRARKTVIELILSNHPDDCLKCTRNQNCELQALAARYGIRENRFEKILKNQQPDDSYAEVVLDRNKCINCGRCVTICQEVQGVYALEYNGRGDNTVIGPVAGFELSDSPCIKCGQCASHCPVGAITFNNPIQQVFEKIGEPGTVTVAAIAPSVRAALAEEFGFESGTLSTGRIYAALRELGFDYVFDTNFGADVTIMEEAFELVQRIKNGGVLPMFTSCCPGWVDYCQKKFHDMLPHLSTCKSPQQMQGALTKTYFAQKAGIDPKSVYNVSIMPCTAKLHESQRHKDMNSSGCKDYDMVLTTRELARLIRQAGIDFAGLEESSADSMLGSYTGAGTIFGNTGGVLEAAVRTAYYTLEGRELETVEFKEARGLEGVKTCSITAGGKTLNLAVVHQIKNIDAVIDSIRQDIAENKEPRYHFIEVMACRGGCIAGGGQPYGVNDEVRRKRAQALYTDDKNCAVRQSHNNPQVKELYADFLQSPGSSQAHKLLHTGYEKLDLYR